jgi:hypothetical protein
MGPFVLPEYFKGKTRSLFWEARDAIPDKDQKAPLTLSLEHREEAGCHSLYKLYMSYPTEYDAAMGILGSWQHWEKLCKCKWFKPYRDAWEDERQVHEQAIAKKALIEQAEEGSVSAARALISFKQRDVNSVVRPSIANHDRPNRKRDSAVDSLLNRFKVVEGSKKNV